MSALPETIAMLLAVAEVFFLLAWFLARDQLSPATRRWGWAGVVVLVGMILWSFWAESLLPYLRKGELKAALATAGGFLLFLLGLGLVFYGGVHVLKSLFTVWSAGDFPARFTPEAIPSAAARWRAVGRFLLDLLLIPGLGWMLFGLGLMAGPANRLVDFDLPMEPRQWITSLALMGIGLLQALASALHTR
jgi:hypothetical protein